MSNTPSIHSLNALGVRAKNIKLAKKQELIRNITRNIGKKEKRVECGHNEKEALSRPITRSVTASRPKIVTIIAETSSLKLRNCEKCDWGPLDFSHVADEIRRDPVYLHVLCKKCGHHNVINLQGENDNENVGARPGSHNNMLARRAALGCLHQGLGHSQYEGLMAAMNIKPVSENTMKQAEREVGILIEETAKESCEKWRREEKRRGEGEGLRGSFDGGKSKGALITQGRVMAPWWDWKRGNASITGQKIRTAGNALRRKKEEFNLTRTTVGSTIPVLLKQWKHQLPLIYVIKKSTRF